MRSLTALTNRETRSRGETCRQPRRARPLELCEIPAARLHQPLPEGSSAVCTRGVTRLCVFVTNRIELPRPLTHGGGYRFPPNQKGSSSALAGVLTHKEFLSTPSNSAWANGMRGKHCSGRAANPGTIQSQARYTFPTANRRIMSVMDDR